ncbi:MAG: protein-tyrosine-phosphatase [Crocinitomicaceae bacterium]
MFPKIQQVLAKMDSSSISEKRKSELQLLIDYVQEKRKADAAILLNFICTHNSRRSQFSQVWAQVAADYYGIEVTCFSGGVEVTAFNERAVASLERFGFDLQREGNENPKYTVKWNDSKHSLVLFSKLYDDASHPTSGFAAIMTCSHADENCPYVAGCEKRIPIRYEDPKNYDDTPLEATFYDYRSFEIGTEMMYVFSKIHS